MPEPQTLDADDLRKELQRIAGELLLFPFVAGSAKAVWIHSSPDLPMSGQFQTTPHQLGAPVYYDILSAGGGGSRADVRRVIDRLLLPTDLRDSDLETATAAERVATWRVLDETKVSAPWLPKMYSYFYVPEPIDDAALHAATSKAESLGIWVVESTQGHVSGAQPRTPRGITNLAKYAMAAWRAARVGSGGTDAEWQIHRDEAAAITQLTTALRVTLGTGRRRATKGTRLITLDD